MKAKRLTVRNEAEQLLLIQEFIGQLGLEWSLDSGLLFKINLVLEEYINNLISYGFSDHLPHEISLEVLMENSKISVIVTDDGNPFDITTVPENVDIDKPLDERKIGGLGIHFIRTLADQIEYHSKDGVNTMQLVISLKDEESHL